MAKRPGRPPHDDLLTPAEWRTLHLVRHGLTNPQIARLCDISIDAVKYHVANVVAKLGVVNRKALKSWSGAPRGTRFESRTIPVAESNKFLGIAQIARSVADVAASERWYRDVLGLDHLYTFDKLAFFACGDSRLMLSETEQGAGDESIIYLRVADINAAHRRLEAGGIVFLNAPHRVHRHDDGTEEWMAFFNDPDGRPLAIASTAYSGDG